MSTTPSDEEIRRRLERQVTDDVLHRLRLGRSRSEVIETLVADGFERTAANAFVQRVSHSPEGKAARRIARPWAPVLLTGFLAGLVAGLGVGGAACSRFWLG
jgi:hypothetical protein